MADDQPGQTIYEDQVSGSASSVPKGALNVAQNGATVVADALTVNFASGATVADAGGGQADVTVTGGGGSSTYVGLTDTPGSFAGDAGQFVKVNSGATALEHIAGETIDDLPVQTGLDAAADKVAVWDDSAGDTVYSLLQDLPSSGGGETNLGANIGAGVGVFEDKSGVTLRFNSLVSQTAALTIAEDDPNDEIDFTIAAATGAVAGLMAAADKTKLDGVETGATADQTGAEIKTAYEGEADTNAFTDAEQTKLAGVATGATDDTTVDAHIADAVDAHAGTAISNTPAGAIAATTVQAAIDELDSEKAATAHTHTLADVTDSGALAALNTVGTTEIDNAAVTLAKIQDIVTDSFIGRDTAGTGVPENLTAATARSVLNVEDGANAPPFVTADYTDASVTFAKIQDVSAQWRVLGRISTGAGALEEIDVSALTDQTSPAGGDVIFAERASDGNLIKIQVGNLPTGGGGEANLGSNLGAGVGVFEGKSGVTLQFNSLVSQTAALTIAEDDPNDEIDFTIDEATVSVAGLLSATDKTKLDNLDTSELILSVRNSTGSTLTALTPIYDNGFNVGQGLMEAAPADSAAAATMPAVGVVIADILNNANGEISIIGQFGGQNTAAFSDTDFLYVASGGGLTATRPTGSVLVQHVATVLRSNASNGELLVQGAGRSNDVPNFEQFSDQTSPVSTTKLLSETAAGGFERVQIGNLPTATASNVGTAGVGVFARKTGADLELKNINSGSSKISIVDDTGNDEIDIDVVEAQVNHDSLAGFVANEHVDHTGVTLTAGDALSGGGDITANRTFDLDINGTADLAAPAVGDELVLGDISNANAIRKADVASIVNLADHDALTNFVADEHVAHSGVSITAGDGLSGGGDISATRQIDVDINGTADLAAPAVNDELMIADTSTASAIRKADVASVVNLADHDALTNFAADEHVAHGGVTLTAGDGLSGGGTIAASRTFDVDISGATDDASPARADEILFDDGAIKKSDIGAVVDLAKPVESFIIAASDETTALTTGTAKTTFRMPYAFTLSEVRASVTTAPTGSVLTVDINEGGTTILSTKITIDATESTSETAATAPVISDTALADDAEITLDIDTVGSTVAGAGLKVTLIGNQA